MSDSDDEIPLSKRALNVNKEPSLTAEPENGHLEKQKTSTVKAEDDVGRSSGDGGATGPAGKAAEKEKMPNIPKTEPSSPKKASAEKPAKGVKAPGGRKTSAEKAKKSKAGAKAAKGAAADGKPKKERKVYELPGQTRDTPQEVDPLRKFYTSLREQRPESAIAAKWLLQVGLLPPEVAKVEAVKLRNARSPMKAAKPGTSTSGAKRKAAAGGNTGSAKKAKPAENGAKKKQPRKRKAQTGESESEDDDDEDSDFDEQPLVKRRKSASKKPAGQPGPKRQTPKGKKDVAFTDGGMDGEDSSDDDMPLAQRAMKVTS
ncbi:g6091 [Coccomyxa viridis]|uniref:G6091 protein n=1 Tax=Coccomyxa viridis TaxID=1274662 RepID=A0ABP1FZE4_9CHLO